MHCYICMAYMVFICTAHPGGNRGITNKHEKRSLFHDVIESLRIRSQLPEELNNFENNLAQSYEKYENEELPGDKEFIPRRNDRIEMPRLKFRMPKSLDQNHTLTVEDDSKEEIVLFIDTTKEPKTTQKPKKPKRTRPPVKNKNKNRDEEIEEVETEKPEEYWPLSNTMAGQSQIGNRESQMVVKPTVIVNIRGSITHRDSDIRIEGRNSNETSPEPLTPQNIFNINQEIKVERNFGAMRGSGRDKAKNAVDRAKEESMIMCETATWNPEKNRETRKYDNVLQIMFSL